MGWLGLVELTLAVVVALVVLPLVGLFVRRRALSQSSTVFDCAMRIGESGPAKGWATGMARYEGDELQWFRIFSFGLRPRANFRRDSTEWQGIRAADPAEAVIMFNGDQIVQLRTSDQSTHELAMTLQAATGLMSWLEAAPPGGDSYSGLTLDFN